MLEKIKTVLSVKLKLHATEEQKRELLELCKVYKDAMNSVLKSVYEDRKRDFRAIHRKYYRLLREKSGMPSQIAINVERKVAQIYASKKDWEKPPERKKLSVDLTYNRTFSIKPDKRVVSITTLSGRLKNIPYSGWERHYEYLRTGRIGDPVLVYDKASKEFYLHVPVEIEIEKREHREVVGVDVGEKNIVAVASTKGESYLIEKAEQYRKVKEKYQKLREVLQSRGTRSAKRKLKALSGREKRFTEHFLHAVSKRLVLAHPQALFVMEDLTGIRSRRRTHRKSSEERRQTEQWAFRRLQQKILYKAILYCGIEPLFVDPHYSSQTCPVCGYVDRANRKSQSDFECRACGYRNHADIVGAINVAIRGLVRVQDENLKGLLVNQPDALLSYHRMEQAPPS